MLHHYVVARSSLDHIPQDIRRPLRAFHFSIGGHSLLRSIVVLQYNHFEIKLNGGYNPLLLSVSDNEESEVTIPFIPT